MTEIEDLTKRHILSVLVRDEDGVISRVSALFTRRAFSLNSIVSAKTSEPGIARLTLTVFGDDVKVEQVMKQLNKLIPVLKVVELDESTSVERSLMIVKVNAAKENRNQILDAVNTFRARVVDMSPESMIVEATGSSSKLKALLEVLEPFGIRELLRSGPVAMTRGSKTMAPSKVLNGKLA